MPESVEVMTFIVTTPIPYTNSALHLGHLLEAVQNDSIARFYRRVYDGDVNLTMGTDQHGQKILEAAEAAGMSPQDFVTQQSEDAKAMWSQYNIQYDSWVDTSSPEHRVVAQLFWQVLDAKGLIFKKKYTGKYCVGCESFKTETELDENGECENHIGKELQTMSEENYFFKLSEFEPRLKNYLETLDIQPERIRKEWMNFMNEGVHDVSISREASKMNWGVPVPGDDSQVMYVWFEAVINYATAQVNLETIDRYLELDSVREAVAEEIMAEIAAAMPVDLMYCSKEIAKFHLLFWPAMLMALDMEPPTRVMVHGMINDGDGRKFSKSMGNALYPDDLFKLFGCDGTRFALLYEVNSTGDTKFDVDAVVDSYNSHLANNLGNLLMRVTTLIDKNFNGLVELDDADKIWDEAEVYEHFTTHLNAREAIELILEAGRKGNELLEQTKPWTMIKEGNTDEAKKVLTNLLLLLKQIGETLSVFLPDTGASIVESATQDIITKAKPLFSKVEVEKN